MLFIQFRSASNCGRRGYCRRGVGGGRATGGVGGGDLVVVAGRSLYARQAQGAGGATRDTAGAVRRDNSNGLILGQLGYVM